MNNEQFRRLLASDAPKARNGASSSQSTLGARPTPSFGGRARVPMTPRSVRGSSSIDFARQLAERNAPATAKPKFKASAAPKGSKLAAGYHDRTKDRVDDEDDDRARRIKALEEQLKLEQIDRATFESLRDQITGGDIGATHLVKGLDRKLLERVRRGEDVMEETSKEAGKQNEPLVNIEDELEALEQKEVAAIAREKTAKRGEMAAPPPVAGVKRGRDAILAELKASRRAAADAAAAAKPQLGSRFSKVGADPDPRVEIDKQGREVLIIKGADGKIKRKVRKAPVEPPHGLLAVDPAAKPLGIDASELPQRAPSPPSDGDDDIFAGVGADYDPLGALGDASESDSDEDVETLKEKTQKKMEKTSELSDKKMSEEETSNANPTAPAPQRNYFNNSGTTETVFEAPKNPLDDPTILAALRNASRKAERDEEHGGKDRNPEEEARLKRCAAMLSGTDRDLEDMDMGFGSSRFDDADEAEENTKVRLSEWKGAGAKDEDDDGDGREGGKKRKRGSKKKKGDKNNAAHVLSVMQRQKGA